MFHLLRNFKLESTSLSNITFFDIVIPDSGFNNTIGCLKKNNSNDDKHNSNGEESCYDNLWC